MESASREKAYDMDLTKENFLGESHYSQVYKIKRKSDGLMCTVKIFKNLLNNQGSTQQQS